MAFTRAPPFSLRGGWPAPFRLKQRFLGGQLQWGRDVSIPEMRRPATSTPMSRSSFNGAGMFPSQKYAAAIFPGVIRDVASMGPGCFDPRNLATLVASADSDIKLQWGRDVSTPEMPASLQGDPGALSLQWGRDVSIPEIR